MPNVNKVGAVPTQGSYSMMRQWMLSRPFEEWEPCRKLRELATGENSSQSKGGVLSKITAGQLAGAGMLTLAAVSAALTTWAEEKAKWLFSTFFYVVLGIGPALMGTIGRSKFLEWKRNELINNIDPVEKVNKQWDRVVFNENPNGKKAQHAVKKSADLILDQGVVINLHGPIGSGKSFTAEAYADLLKQKYPDKEIVLCKLKHGFMSAKDDNLSIFGVKLGSGSKGEQLEGILTHLADLHKKSNGQKIFVLVANEGHELLGSRGGSNPFSRSETQSRLGYIFDQKEEYGFRGKLGAGVALIVTHNCDHNEEHLEDRTDANGFLELATPDARIKLMTDLLTLDLEFDQTKAAEVADGLNRALENSGQTQKISNRKLCEELYKTLKDKSELSSKDLIRDAADAIFGLAV